MTNPADQAVANLINTLAKKAAHPFTDASERQDIVNQIAQLRASMNVPIIQQKD